MNHLEFQALDWHSEDTTDFDAEYDDGSDYASRYMITIFGRNEAGQSVTLQVQGFTPQFYIEIPDHWTKSTVDMFMNQLRYKVYRQHRESLVTYELVNRKKFLGFRNNRKYKFVQLSFHSKKGMNQYMKGLAENFAGLGLPSDHVFPLHETNIDPMLRFMHLRDLQACGWLKVPEGKYLEIEVSPSTCDIACVTSWKWVQLLEKAAIAPVRVASFDIEADSSHGDFPVAKKRYHKLARELAETNSKLPLVELISMAFSQDDANPAGISRIFTKDNREPAACSVEAASGDIKSKRLLQSIHSLQDAKDTKTLTHSVKRLLRQWYDAKKGCVAHEGIGQAIQRYIQELTGVLDKHLPPVEGDHVIQIGTTVTVYGEKECVKRHIITLGSCDPLPGIDVESYDTEKEVLLAWSKFITELDPDVITG